MAQIGESYRLTQVAGFLPEDEIPSQGTHFLIFMVARVGNAPTSQAFQTRTNLPQLPSHGRDSGTRTHDVLIPNQTD